MSAALPEIGEAGSKTRVVQGDLDMYVVRDATPFSNSSLRDGRQDRVRLHQPLPDIWLFKATGGQPAGMNTNGASASMASSTHANITAEWPSHTAKTPTFIVRVYGSQGSRGSQGSQGRRVLSCTSSGPGGRAVLDKSAPDHPAVLHRIMSDIMNTSGPYGRFVSKDMQAYGILNAWTRFAKAALPQLSESGQSGQSGQSSQSGGRGPRAPTATKPRRGRTAEPVADPLAAIRHLSWPVSATVHILKERKRVVILGDMHRSLRGACSPCEGPACMTINDLLHALVDYSTASATNLDVLIEHTLIPNTGRSAAVAREAKAYDDHIGSLWARMRQGVLSALSLDTVYGQHPGYIQEVVHEFRHLFLKPPPSVTAQGVRFHLGDGRVNTLLKTIGADLRGLVFGHTYAHTWDTTKDAAFRTFMKTYTSLDQFERVVRALCFSKAAITDMRQGDSLPDAMCTALRRHPLMNHGMYKAAKQFWKLQQPRDRASVTKFYERVLRPQQHSAIDALFRAMREASMKLPATDRVPDQLRIVLANIMLMYTMSLMDVYVVCRMLHYSQSQQAPGSTVVVYAGDYHAMHYRAFFTTYAIAKPSCTYGIAPKLDVREDVKRCVPLRNKC